MSINFLVETMHFIWGKVISPLSVVRERTCLQTWVTGSLDLQRIESSNTPASVGQINPLQSIIENTCTPASVHQL